MHETRKQWWRKAGLLVRVWKKYADAMVRWETEVLYTPPTAFFCRLALERRRASPVSSHLVVCVMVGSVTYPSRKVI